MSKKEKVFPLNTFGGRMQDLRKNRLKISRPEFYDLIYPNGNVANESKSRTVKNWESGACEPDLKTITKICIILKCSSDYLFGMDNCTTKDTQFVHNQTGLSETAILELRQLYAETVVYGDANYDLDIINTLIEQLNHKNNSVLHWLTIYLHSKGLRNDLWYYTESGTISTKKYISTEAVIHLEEKSDTFDNLILMGLENRIKALKPKS